MNLLIDTSEHEQTTLGLAPRGVFRKFGPQNLSENLLPEIKNFLKKQNLELQDLKKIEIRTGSHFSRTRTTVAVANALIFTLKLKQKMFEPAYDKEPNITLSKK